MSVDKMRDRPEKVTQIHAPRPKENIFTEGINYFEVGEDSLWGKGDEVTLRLLQSTQLSGKWLDLGAGDGRYAPILLSQVDQLVAADIDRGALTKLWYRSPKKLRYKLQLIVFNLTKPFPIRNQAFDGVFCTGTLHYFPMDILIEITREIDRVLKPGGRVILDFPYDVGRHSADGERYFREGSARYEGFPMDTVFSPCFGHYDIQVQESEFEDDLTQTLGYILRGRFALLVADKRTSIEGHRI